MMFGLFGRDQSVHAPAYHNTVINGCQRAPMKKDKNQLRSLLPRNMDGCIITKKERVFAVPNKTFDHLPDEKKQAVVRAALKEFTAHDYTSASLNDIIADIGIAKGSFYRYFNNKRELYDYLIAYGLEKKYQYVNQNKEPADDIFQLIPSIVKSYIQFNLENAELAAFMQKAVSENQSVRDNYLFLKNGRQVLIDKIIESQKRGTLSTQFSADFVYFCISQLLMGSPSYVKNKYLGEKELSEYLLYPFDKQQEIKDHIVLYYQQIVDFLKSGFNGSSTDKMR